MVLYTKRAEMVRNTLVRARRRGPLGWAVRRNRMGIPPTHSYPGGSERLCSQVIVVVDGDEEEEEERRSKVQLISSTKKEERFFASSCEKEANLIKADTSRSRSNQGL